MQYAVNVMFFDGEQKKKRDFAFQLYVFSSTGHLMSIVIF